TGDYHVALAELRAQGPVHRHDELQLWAVVGHEQVLAVSRDPQTFSSAKGILLADRGRHLAGNESIIYLDPPIHQLHRRLVNSAFHARRIAGLEDFVRGLVREPLDKLSPGETTDMVEALAVPLPLQVIAELLGVPESDRDRFRAWTDAV